ncbi:MAG: MBL fold metallo-hydrolase [Cryomorphaceae bacterium]|nr:MBL fold metallo-hydrolase [Cryomorphaceae bacterium]
MKLYAINTGNFKLDGGAMFGVVPKSIWSKTNSPDKNNMIDVAARCLLIEDEDKLILIDCGMGNKQSEKFFNYYCRWGEQGVDQALLKHGFHKDDVTDVFLTHLHFDHCGGGVEWNQDRTGFKMTFKNARYWSNAQHWAWAVNPNKREKASFLKENLSLIQSSGQLNNIIVPKGYIKKDCPFGFDVFFVDGHTEKQMLPMIKYKDKTICFMADLLPTTGHIGVPYVMGYDIRPLTTLKEKDVFLNLAASHNYYLFLEHDPIHELITVKSTEKGVKINKLLSLKDIL